MSLPINSNNSATETTPMLQVRDLAVRENLNSGCCNRDTARKVAIVSGALFATVATVSANYLTWSDVAEKGLTLETGIPAGLMVIADLLGAAIVPIYTCFGYKVRKFLPYLFSHTGESPTIWPHNTTLKDEEINEKILELIAKFQGTPMEDTFDEWLSLKKFSSLEDPAMLEKLKKMAKQGNCKGHTMALLRLMPEQWELSFGELIKKVDLDDIPFLQMAHRITNFVNRKKIDELTTEYEEHLQKINPVTSPLIDLDIQIDIEKDDAKKLLLKQTAEKIHKEIDEHNAIITANCLKILTILDHSGIPYYFQQVGLDLNYNFKSTNSLIFPKKPNEIFDEVTALFPKFNAKTNLYAGEIRWGKQGEKNGHSLFIQISPTFCRLFDIATTINGCFEFDTLPKFFDTLAQHLKATELKEGDTFRIGLYEIPLQKKSDDVIVDLE